MNRDSGSTRRTVPARARAVKGAGSLLDVSVQRIEQVVQPAAQQQPAFDDLKKATQKANDQLPTSCPTAVRKSPVARLDMIERRLTGRRHQGSSPGPSELLRLAE
jgi:hypothetical protein